MNPFKYYKSSPSIIKLAIMYYVRYPLSLLQVEDILYEHGIDICHETGIKLIILQLYSRQKLHPLPSYTLSPQHHSVYQCVLPIA